MALLFSGTQDPRPPLDASSVLPAAASLCPRGLASSAGATAALSLCPLGWAASRLFLLVSALGTGSQLGLHGEGPSPSPGFHTAALVLQSSPVSGLVTGSQTSFGGWGGRGEQW